MQKSEANGFDIVAGNNTNSKNSWIQIEQLDEHEVRLCGGWQNSEYVGLDRHTAGSTIFSNKTKGNVFELLTKQQATALQQVQAEVSQYVIYNMQGVRLETRDASAGLALGAVYGQGIYLVQMLDAQGRLLSTKKITVR